MGFSCIFKFSHHFYLGFCNPFIFKIHMFFILLLFLFHDLWMILLWLFEFVDDLKFLRNRILHLINYDFFVFLKDNIWQLMTIIVNDIFVVVVNMMRIVLVKLMQIWTILDCGLLCVDYTYFLISHHRVMIHVLTIRNRSPLSVSLSFRVTLMPDIINFLSKIVKFLAYPNQWFILYISCSLNLIS